MERSQSAPKTLGEFLKEIMKSHGLTERTFAQGAGIAQSGLSNLLQGKLREPDPRTLRAMANFLGIDVFILFRYLEYVPSSNEPYGAYSPLSLYLAHRFDELPVERQRVVLHVAESLLEDIEVKREMKAVRENPNPAAELVGMGNMLPEKITECGRWYLTNGRFASLDEIDLQDDEEVYPGLRFGDLDNSFRVSLVAYLRYMMRQVFTPDLVKKEYR